MEFNWDRRVKGLLGGSLCLVFAVTLNGCASVNPENQIKEELINDIEFVQTLDALETIDAEDYEIFDEILHEAA